MEAQVGEYHYMTKTSRITLNCMLLPVQYREYEYGPKVRLQVSLKVREVHLENCPLDRRCPRTEVSR